MMEKDREEIAAFAFAAIGFVLFGAIFLVAIALATRVAWNMVMPEVFGLPQLTLKNAFGLVGLGVAFRFFPVSLEGVRK
jgi:hypothetical protein